MEDMQLALERGRSKYTVADLINRMFEGNLRVFIGDKMTASATVENGVMVPGHVTGCWNASDALWMVKRFHAYRHERGIKEYSIEGRRGWIRFMRMKGVEL